MADTMYITDDGIKDNLDTWVAAASSPYLPEGWVRLFRNNVTVSKATLLGALTESGFPGYAAQPIGSAAFPAGTVTSHVASSLYPAAFSFVCTGGGTTENAYGGYITDFGGTRLLACWNFAAGPFVMFNNGDTINCTPTVTSESKN